MLVFRSLRLVLLRSLELRVSGTPRRTKRGLDASGDVSTAPRCLVRATIEKKKISTWVRVDAVDEFHERLADIMKVHFDGLKRKKRKKRTKKNAGTYPKKQAQ